MNLKERLASIYAIKARGEAEKRQEGGEALTDFWDEVMYDSSILHRIADVEEPEHPIAFFDTVVQACGDHNTSGGTTTEYLECWLLTYTWRSIPQVPPTYLQEFLRGFVAAARDIIAGGELQVAARLMQIDASY